MMEEILIPQNKFDIRRYQRTKFNKKWKKTNKKRGRNFFHQDVKNLLQQISFQTSLISQIYYTISILVKTVHRNQYIFLEELEQDEIIIIQCEKFLNRRDKVFLINRLLFNDSIHEKYS